MKLLLASIYTIVSVSLITGIVFWLGGSSVMSRTDIMLIGIPVSAVVAVVFIVLWGLPTHAFLVKIKHNFLKWYAFSGFLTGPLFVFIAKPFGDDPFLHKLFQSIYCGLIGAFGATVFWWFIAKQNKHNKQLNMDSGADAPPPVN